MGVLAMVAASLMQTITPIPLSQIVVADKFWAPRQETLRKRTLPHEFEMLRVKGYLRNFELAASGAHEGFQGFVFQDSDVYKVLESAALSLVNHKDASIEKEIDTCIELIRKAQMPDGYVNTHFQITKPDKRWTNLRDWHELYCAGHLIEAAVAHFEATKQRSLLDTAIKFANHIVNRFATEGKEGYPGHPELELALVKLSKATGDKKYFDLAEHFILTRGSHYFAREHGTKESDYDGSYWQDRVPIRQWDIIEGHAVRATYLLSGVTDIVLETGNAELKTMMQRVWKNTTQRKTYVTGGIGSSGSNEGFSADYDLPNDTAYQETCASISMAMWNHRLALLYGEAKYMDFAETALYNAALSGISLEGTHFFYDNPLESKGAERPDWYACACCPPNIARTIAQIGHYAYAESSDAIWMNLYIGGSFESKLANVKVDTEYPWDGKVDISLEPKTNTSFALNMRVPGWCNGATISVNGKKVNADEQNGYLSISHKWQSGDEVELNLPMPVRRIESHPAVIFNRGRLAVARGPMIYCLEEADNILPVTQVAVAPDAKWAAKRSSDLGGIVELRTDGSLRESGDWHGGLYAPSMSTKTVHLRAIPYYAWANRGKGEMVVWMHTTPPMPVVAGFERSAHVSVSFENDNADKRGANDGTDPKSSADWPAANCHFWPHKGGQEWVQYNWKSPVAISYSRVYWFDDTGRGECKIPAKWHLEYETNNTWRRIDCNYTIAKDKWCDVEFPAVTTQAMRLVVEQQPGWASGILEWQVFGEK